MNNPPPVPRCGQIWEAVNDCEAHIQYLFTAPITFSGVSLLTTGERIRITTEPTDSQPKVSFQPVRYAELHDRLVPRDIRETPRYKEYLLSLKTEDFHAHFKLIADPHPDIL